MQLLVQRDFGEFEIGFAATVADLIPAIVAPAIDATGFTDAGTSVLTTRGDRRGASSATLVGGAGAGGSAKEVGSGGE